MNADYNQKIIDNKERQQKSLKSQEERFKSVYDKNSDQMRRSFQVQEDLQTKALAATKNKFLKSVDKFKSKEDDPFYSIPDRGSYLRETSDAFVIHAYIPEHEKDAVRVAVQPDKVSIMGQRAFKDAVVDDDGKRVTGSTYQDFREEFAFSQPVILEGVTKKRSGDWVTIDIPKLQKFGGLSKKA
jgi:HSP20 family molecular chaperone IbpA